MISLKQAVAERKGKKFEFVIDLPAKASNVPAAIVKDDQGWPYMVRDTRKINGKLDVFRLFTATMSANNSLAILDSVGLKMTLALM